MPVWLALVGLGWSAFRWPFSHRGHSRSYSQCKSQFLQLFSRRLQLVPGLIRFCHRHARWVTRTILWVHILFARCSFLEVWTSSFALCPSWESVCLSSSSYSGSFPMFMLFFIFSKWLCWNQSSGELSRTLKVTWPSSIFNMEVNIKCRQAIDF